MGRVSLGVVNPIIPSNRVQQRLERLRQLVPNNKKKRMYVSEFPDKSFQKWHSVDCAKLSGEVKTLIQGSINHYIDWCENNCDSKFVVYRKVIWFEKEEDATFFLMVWG